MLSFLGGGPVAYYTLGGTTIGEASPLRLLWGKVFCGTYFVALTRRVQLWGWYSYGDFVEPIIVLNMCGYS